MVAFPLEFFNFITDVQSFKIIPNFWPVNKTKSRNKMKLLNNLTLTDIRGKIINTKDVKIKIIQKILNKKSIPKCQDKWNNVYNEEFHWSKI
jgi:hypothetical protein